jgi:quinoprotein glucose dehydrogenase
MREVAVLLFFFLLAISPRAADPAAANHPELDAALRKLRVVPGFRAQIFAAEPLIQNPVSFAFDERGRAYVVETHRRRTSVFDIRNHPDWLDDDFSFRTVADRSNFFRKVLVPGNTNLPPRIVVDRNGDGKFDAGDLEVESERIRLLEDRNGDGVADHATTFADGFKTIVSGVAAGVLARKGDVYFTCIPDLWLLRDSDNDGVADQRKSLAHGFGVHISFGGHDLHGLKFGPDGKLYFSIADRGLNVESGGKTLANPDSGAVLRCNPDGSDLELYATGFRNPQELAFDQYGNLWTGENNGDGGDKARWLYVVEGGNYGWHYGWQHLPKMGAWNAEGLWELPPNNTATYLLPPVAHIGHGPAGIAFYPGTGLPGGYRNHFFMTDFPGGVHSFAVQNRGAGFEVYDQRQFLWELYPVDIDFGPEGGAYVLDWVEGWEKTGKGRLFRIFEEQSVKDPLVAQTKKLLSEGFSQRSIDELGILLGFVDQRVRMEAQFELAARGLAATNVLGKTAHNSPNELARMHSIWAIGQIARREPAAYTLILPLVDDLSNSEIRAQAAKTLGGNKFGIGYAQLAKAALDPIPRVRYFGVMGLGKLGESYAGDTIIQVLRENNDADPYLRHAGVTALAALNDMNALEKAARDDSPAVRLGALLAMRKLQRPEIAMFLYDQRPQLVLEAARAIYDLPIDSGLSQLAAMINKPAIPKAAMRRALHANYRIGKLENAMALAEFSATTSFLPELRADAIDLLGRWAQGTKRDLFVGLWRPVPEREARAAALTIRSELPGLLAAGALQVRVAAVEAAARLGIDTVAPELSQIFARTNEPPELRLASLRALADIKTPRLAESLKLALNDPHPPIRKFASSVRVHLNPADRTAAVLRMLDKGSLVEKQSALELLGTMEGGAVDPVLSMWLDRVISGKAPRELHLEILEAAARRDDPLIKSQFQRFNETRARDPLANYSEALAGGDAELGRKVFLERADVACLRCHKLNGIGGEVGPELAGVGTRLTREQLLESIVLPNARLTPGYENLLITLKDGASHVGLLRKEDAENVYIESPEDGALKIPKAEIQTLDLGLSSMLPDIATMLSKRDLRNLIEFLAAQK